jgi:hypothetical protein
MGIIDNVKDVANLAREVGKMELYAKAVDLMAQVTELAQENFDLKQELLATKQNQKIEETLVFWADRYWRKIGEEIDGPFCSKCWDSSRKLIRLHRERRAFPTCPECTLAVANASRKSIPADVWERAKATLPS